MDAGVQNWYQVDKRLDFSPHSHIRRKLVSALVVDRSRIVRVGVVPPVHLGAAAVGGRLMLDDLQGAEGASGRWLETQGGCLPASSLSPTPSAPCAMRQETTPGV